MIVRETAKGFLLIRQHDHGWVSGEFGERWRKKPEPFGSTQFAIRYHDVGWEKLDGTPKWNPKTGRPFSFVDHPLSPKLSAYTGGIDWVERRDAYAACLCSMHYVSFFSGVDHPEALRFVKEERMRQERLKERLPEEEIRRLTVNLRLLKLCDDLSLFVCLNEPGTNTHPWYRNGFQSGENRWIPIWEDAGTLRLDPNPFTEDFQVTIPYQVTDPRGKLRETGRYRIRVVTSPSTD